MHSRDDDVHGLTEADRTSRTRFGPRPVPKGHKTASPYPHRPMRSSRVIPSAPMSLDGRAAYPAPSLASRMIVWGGVAVGVAGLTAGAVLAARRIAGTDKPSKAELMRQQRMQPAVAPRFAEMDEVEQERMRQRVRARARDDQKIAARQRAKAAQSRGNIAQDLTDTADNLSDSLDGVVSSLIGAFHGFRSVAGQASGIVGDFAAAADQISGLLRRDRPNDPRDAAAPRTSAQDRTHRL